MAIHHPYIKREVREEVERKQLHRPYIRKEVREEVERRAKENGLYKDGHFLDANTDPPKPIYGKYDLGHDYGHEYWREAQKAEEEGLSQAEFNERMNNPEFYRIEDPHENRSHVHEKKDGEEKTKQIEESKENEQAEENEEEMSM